MAMNTFHWLRAFLILLATCAVVVLLSSQALADGHGKGKHHAMPTYAEIDADGDAQVSTEEFYAFRAQRMAAKAAAGGKMKNAAKAPTFEELDLDGDGNLSTEEFAQHQAQCPMKGKRGKQQD